MPVSFGFVKNQILAKIQEQQQQQSSSSSLSIPVTNSLVAYFDAYESSSYSGSGTAWSDISGNSHTGSINSTIVSYENDTEAGGVFDITPDGVNTPGTLSISPSFTSTEVTYMAWVRHEGVPGAYAGILEQNPYGYTGLLYNAGGGLTTFPAFSHNTGLTPPRNEWFMVTYVRTATEVKMYLNDTAGNSYPSSNSDLTFSEFKIGWDNGASRVFNGKFQSALVFNRALSASEVSSMYNYFYDRLHIDNNVVLDLDAGNTSSYSGSGSTWTDLSGNANHATLQGSPVWSSSFGGTFSLDNTDDWIDISIETNNNSFTFETWFNSDRTETGADYAYFFQGDQVGSGHGPGVAMLEGEARSVGGNPMQPGDLYVYTGSGVVPLNYNLPKNSWKHLLFSWDVDNDEVKLYENGVLKSTISTTATPEDIERISFFTTSNGGFMGHHLKGSIGSVRVYRGVLDIAEITHAYDQSKSRFDVSSYAVMNIDATNSSSYSGSGNTAFDLSTNGYDLELINVTYDSNSPESFDFAGLNQYARTSAFNSSSDGNFTGQLWVNPDALGNRTFMAKHGQFQFFLSNGNYFFRLLSPTTLSSGSLDWQYSIGTTLPLGSWTHISFSYDGTTRKIYVNGSLIASNTAIRSSFTENSNIFLLGAAWEINPGSVGGYPFDGKISQMQLHHTVLTDDEILAHFNWTKGNYGY